MTERWTRKDAEKALARLAEALGKQVGWTWTKQGDRNVAGPIGAWALDYNPTYGGCKVIELSNYAGGERDPLSDGGRCSPREFCDRVRFALEVLYLHRPTQISA